MSAEFLDRCREIFVTESPAGLGPRSRGGVLSVVEVNEGLDSLVEALDFSPRGVDLVRSLLLLWHDHLDASHDLSQDLGSADGSYVHGIMHRREPDYPNSKYWFRRAGDHPCFPQLAERAGEILSGTILADQLIPDGNWDPYAFVDACERFLGSSGAEEALLQRVQMAEFELLLESFAQ